MHQSLVFVCAGLALAGSVSACSEDRAPDADAAVLRVLERGASPASDLSHDVTRGARQEFTLVSQVNMALAFADEVVPETGIPAVRLGMVAEADEGGGGDYRFRFQVEDASLVASPGNAGDPRARLALERELAEGTPRAIGGHVVVKRHGADRESTMTLPARSSSLLRTLGGQVRQAIEELSTPLPGETLGPGARWAVKRSLQLSGAELEVQATYTLLRREGNDLYIEAEFVYGALPQVMKLPNLPEGDQARVVELHGQGRGTLVLDPAKPLPREARLDSKLDLRLALHTGNEDRSLDATIRTVTEVRAADAPDAVPGGPTEADRANAAKHPKEPSKE